MPISNSEIICYIENHLYEEITVDKIAQYFGYSKFHFERLFKQQMKVSVMEYVRKRRLTSSIDKIVEGTKIIDVAMDLGWQSHSSFSKAFKKEFGISPSYVKAMCITISNMGGDIMNEFNYNLTCGNESSEELYHLLRALMEQNQMEVDDEFHEMYLYAQEVYKDKKRYSGEEYITHILNIAIILVQMEVDIHVIEAGLFCDVYNNGFCKTLNFEIEKLPVRMRELVHELAIKNMDTISEEGLLILIAQRLHNMRTIEYMPEEKWEIKARETIDIFIPVARKTENERLIQTLNELCMKYIE